MTLSKFKTACTLVLIALVTGCAQPYPVVEDSFEASWVSNDYQAQAYLIPTADEAFARRVDLVRNANTSIDMTYFSWDKNTLGLMLLDELKQAADRGVKVRLTLDDLLVFNEKWLAELDQHQNIQIKIFNPFNSRKIGWFGRVFDYAGNQQQLDNRLHEKYFNADHQSMILGGRNIGDEYFGFSKEANFFDMDTLFSGDIIEPFADNYELLWESEYVTPIHDLISIKDNKAFQNFDKAYAKASNKNPETIAVIERSIARLSKPEALSVQVTPVFDSLNKLHDNKPYFRTRAEQTISEYLDNAETAIISTPYVVPSDGEFKTIDRLTNKDTKVTLITNSSASNDSGFIPAYYEKHRTTLLKKGVNLLEYKDDAINEDHYYHADTYYHNKTLILDSKLTYIGSSNFDPRSDNLNIEFGVFIHSTEFAKQIEHYLLNKKEELYWQVSLNAEDKPVWQSADTVTTKNPNYSKMHKATDWMFRKMNSESEL
ncbi:phospholipase D family protein [Vibrio superstes]|uniref:Phospholipase D family protein n=1 Tax=Vibrio superstes NBRC 103154 TaxID=1219062 RepID=A0A511QMN8_9VIBR|nr:phospholipase D family protein [Vibrio superstes]GEM77792.1 phospholipase D family protein [Vibrio superstes NBRC 103154]